MDVAKTKKIIDAGAGRRFLSTAPSTELYIMNRRVYRHVRASGDAT